MYLVIRELTPRRLFACVAVYFLSLSMIWISSAYAAMLNKPSQSSEARSGSTTIVSARGDRVEIPAPQVSNIVDIRVHDRIDPRSDSLLGDMLNTANANRSMLVWSMYPASVRGRIFSGNIATSNPFSTMGGGGW